MKISSIIGYLKRVGTTSLFAGCVLMSFQSTFIQSAPNESVQKYNLTFPIDELGGCQNLAECRTYCDDPLHKTECIAFAKEKHIPTQAEGTENSGAILSQAQKTLGCGSADSCRAFCEQEANYAT